MFSSLRSSERQYYSPRGFCAAFRDWEGRPVNVLQQMDADEFLNLLTDQLEQAMGGGPTQPQGAPGFAGPGTETASGDGEAGEADSGSLLRRLFGGKLCTEIIPKMSSAPRSERQEDFLVLSLQVKGKPSVHASLAAFVEGETLEGDNAYFSQEAGCKVDAEKRTSICSLPETLVLGLKRFEFDLDLMQKVKVNDLYEFPMRLNMWPYTRQALDSQEVSPEEEEPFQYTLCGIVLHSGTADSGHYSSLVKVAEEAGHAQWYEFNDTMVTPFNEEDIPQEAFGGSADDEIRGAPAHSKNAYLLFYKRAAVVARSAAPAGGIREAAAATAAVGGALGTPEAASPAAASEAIRRSVESANCQYWHVQALFSQEYADFVWMLASNFHSSPALLAPRGPAAPATEKQLLESVGALKFMQLAQLRRDASGGAEAGSGVGAEAAEAATAECAGGALPLLVCQLVVSFFCTVLVRSRDRRSLPEWSSLLVRLLRRAGPPAHGWFAGLLTSHGFVRELFLECPLPESRMAVLAVAAQVLRWLYEEEADALRSHLAEVPAGEPRHGQRWPPELELVGSGGPGASAGGEDGGAGRQPPVLAQIWATLIELLPAAQQQPAHANFQHFFMLLQDWLRLGPEALAWARKAGGVDELVEFALQDARARVLPAVLERARRWYLPNPLRRAAAAPGAAAASGGCSTPAPARAALVPREVVLGNGDGEGPQAATPRAGAADSEDPGADSSFERQLRSELAGDAVELGPLWGACVLLLEGDAERVRRHSDENDALLRRLVRLGGATAGSRGPAGRLVQLLCRGDLARSQGAVCRICERADECDGRALRTTLRMGSALIDLSDAFTQQRGVFLLKSLLHVARNNRKYFRTMHVIVHYILKWCRLRPELPQWLLSDAGNSNQYRWLEAWVKENSSAGGNDAWQGWQTGGYPGQMAGIGATHAAAPQDAAGSAKWNWCSEVLPLVRRLVRGEALPRSGGGDAEAGGDSDAEAAAQANTPELAAGGRERPVVLPAPRTLLGAARVPPPVLSKVQMVNSLAASARNYQHPASNMSASAVW